MTTSSLKECAEPLPVCTQTAGLSAVLEIFRSSGCDAIVVVSEQQRPLGVVNLRRIIPHLMSRENGDIEQPLSQLQPPVIEPLEIVSASLSLSQFLAYLNQEREMAKVDQGGNCTIENGLHWQFSIPHTQHWALIEKDGQFVGLLNSWLLLKALAPKYGIAHREAIADELAQPNQLQLLIELLEQLPLPLSLQTSAGETLAENPSWRQLLGTSLELDWARSPTAKCLEHSSVKPSTELASLGLSTKPFREGGEVASPEQVRGHRGTREEFAVAAPKLARAVLSNTTKRSLWTVGNVAQQQYKSSNPQADNCYCISDRRQLATAPQNRELRKKNPERLFSFTQIPLSPLLLEDQEPEVGKTKQPGKRKFSHSPLSNLWLVLAQDNTEQHQVAEELAAKNADLIQLNRLKDEFLACISHELKTPLTAVLGLSTLLKDQALGTLNERQARYARLIYQSGRQLMMLVNDILDLTRIETGQLELTPEPIQIQTVCDRAYTQARQVYLEKDQQHEESTPEIPFTLEIEPGLDTMVADELRLRQMLVHLLSNALKFTDINGEIGLRVNAFEGWITFTVWDTGIGIPAEKQHLIFQKFQQLESPLTRRFEGTGLGLVLTQRLARLHGGDISFISKSDEGSEFTLLLPPSPPREKSAAATSNPQSPSRNRLVLIVETVVRYLEDLTTQLKSLGYWVVVARSAMEAIAKARSLQPHAIFLNPMLPQLSGWDVLTLLKSDAQTCHIPILVTATSAEKDQAYARNADGFLSLPIQKPVLLQSLTRLGKPNKTTNSVLTILYLSSGLIEMPPNSSRLMSQLTEVLNMQHSELKYRVLEADDLEQAELLARVWHPNVVLLDGAGIGNPLAYLQAFSLHPSLATLPLVTLDRGMTQAANQVIGLSVYPCLAPDNQDQSTALLEVIQVAAGLSHQSSILVMDISVLHEATEIPPLPLSNSLTCHTPWLQALMQYLQTAGFRSSLSCSWAEVYRQLQDGTVDLLLIRLKDITNPSGLLQGLMGLGQLPNLPPILVLDHRLETPVLNEGAAEQATAKLEYQLQAIATQILHDHSHSMTQLLDRIYQILGNREQGTGNGERGRVLS